MRNDRICLTVKTQLIRFVPTTARYESALSDVIYRTDLNVNASIIYVFTETKPEQIPSTSRCQSQEDKFVENPYYFS